MLSSSVCLFLSGPLVISNLFLQSHHTPFAFILPLSLFIALSLVLIIIPFPFSLTLIIRFLSVQLLRSLLVTLLLLYGDKKVAGPPPPPSVLRSGHIVDTLVDRSRPMPF